VTLAAGTSEGGGGGESEPTNITIGRSATTVTVESDTGTDGTIEAATTSLAGVMSSSDKSKLDSIAFGATISNLGSSLTATSITITNSGGMGVGLAGATTSIAGLLTGADKAKLNGIATGATITNLSNTPGASNVVINNSGGASTTLPAATPSLAGVMSASDKTAVNTLTAAPVNVTMLGNWTTYDPTLNAPTQVLRIGRMVTLSGIITTPTFSGAMFNVPVEFRPPSNVVLLFGTAGPGLMLAYVDASTGDVVSFVTSGSPATYTLVQGSYFI
jgi:hypothetical protein